MMGKNLSIILTAFMLLAAGSAFGEVSYYKGELEILKTSGQCGPDIKGKREIELVLKLESSAQNQISGYFFGVYLDPAKFSGSKPSLLAVSYPFFQSPNSEGHSLVLSFEGETLTGELHEKHLESTSQYCNSDSARLELKKIRTGADTERKFDELEGRFNAAGFGSEASYWVEEGRYGEAEPLYKRALQVREATLGKDHPDVAASLNDLAVLFWMMGRYGEAEPLYKRSLQIREAALGKDHPDVASSLNNLAVLYRKTGRFGEAEPLYKRALQVRETALGKDHPDVASSLNNLAGLYYDTGRYGEAEQLYKRALEILETTLGRDHPDVAASLNNLASLYDDTGRYGEAEPLYKRALQIREAKLGKDHPEVAQSLNNLAAFYDDTGRYAEAEPLYKRALLVREATLGRNHPDVAQSLNNLAVLYRKTGRYAEAEPLYKRTLEIWEAKLGKDHPDVAISLNSLAVLYMETGNYREAEPLLKRALLIAQGAIVPETLRFVQDNYSDLLAKGGRREAAIFFGKQAVNTVQGLRRSVAQIDKETLKIYGATVESVYKHLSGLLIDAGRLAEAQKVIDLLKEEEYFEFVRRDEKEAESLSGKADYSGPEVRAEAAYRLAAAPLVKLAVERGALVDKQTRSQDEETRLAQIDKDLDKAGEAFQNGIDEISRELSEKRRDKVNEIEEAQGLQQDLRELGQDAAALYTLVGENSYRTILISPDFRNSYEYRISEADLNRKINAFREVLRDPERDPRPLARELYDILVAPAAADLKELKVRTIMWSLDGALRYLPVAALHDGEHYLVETYRSVIFTPASKTRLKDKPNASWKALGLGVSKAIGGFNPLPAVGEELAGIIKTAEGSPRGMLPGLIQLDDTFTLNAMKDGLRKQFPLVHIASHFKFAPGDDTKSFLLLGDGTHLPLSDLKRQNNLFGGVDLLTLSACNTGMGDGREVDGFAIIAQRQGAKAVVATLWPVADESTGLFMRDFYRLREQEKLNKAESLQRAQVMFIKGEPREAPKDPQNEGGVPVKAEGAKTGSEDLPFTPAPEAPYSHPYYWAPFIMIGNWQ